MLATPPLKSISSKLSTCLRVLKAPPQKILMTNVQAQLIVSGLKSLENKIFDLKNSGQAMLDQLSTLAHPAFSPNEEGSEIKTPTDFLSSEAQRQSLLTQTQVQSKKIDRLLQMMLLALQMGNIDLAMLVFSSLESQEATQMSQQMNQKLLDAQNQRRELTGQMANLKDQKQMPQLQNKIQEVNDSIQLLTAFIKDINDQKNRTLEFAHNFLSSEHQTTMSLVRN